MLARPGFEFAAIKTSLIRQLTSQARDQHFVANRLYMAIFVENMGEIPTLVKCYSKAY
jgi:hypothetical protein